MATAIPPRRRHATGRIVLALVLAALGAGALCAWVVTDAGVRLIDDADRWRAASDAAVATPERRAQIGAVAAEAVTDQLGEEAGAGAGSVANLKETVPREVAALLAGRDGRAAWNAALEDERTRFAAPGAGPRTLSIDTERFRAQRIAGIPVSTIVEAEDAPRVVLLEADYTEPLRRAADISPLLPSVLAAAAVSLLLLAVATSIAAAGARLTALAMCAFVAVAVTFAARAGAEEGVRWLSGQAPRNLDVVVPAVIDAAADPALARLTLALGIATGAGLLVALAALVAGLGGTRSA